MIQNLLARISHSLQCKSETRSAIQSRWVETADERCPIACTWFTVPEGTGEQEDEPGLAWPVFLRLRRRTGFLSHFLPAL